MIEKISIKEPEPVIGLASEIVYRQEPYWCGASARALKLSFMGPRRYYPYDPEVPARPCILFFCGGGFQKQDRNVWIPELVEYAKRGYNVITADYDTFAFTRFPQPLIEAKAALRFIKANAEHFHIDPDRIAVMGESAGGQLASWVAATMDDPAYEDGAYPEQDSHVKACVCMYPVTDVNAFSKPDTIRVYTDNFPDTCKLVTGNEPPFLIFHGTDDNQVPHSQSVALHEKLRACNVPCFLYLVEGANHAGPEFSDPEIKEKILAFLANVL